MLSQNGEKNFGEPVGKLEIIYRNRGAYLSQSLVSECAISLVSECAIPSVSTLKLAVINIFVKVKSYTREQPKAYYTALKSNIIPI